METEVVAELIETRGGVNPLEMPVDITAYDADDNDWVEFTVSQMWVDTQELSWFSTYYEQTSGVWTCPKKSQSGGLPWGHVGGPFMAKCHDGFANVTLIAYDGSFKDKATENITDILPQKCRQMGALAGRKRNRKTMNVMRVPCSPVCATTSPDFDCDAKQPEVEETRGGVDFLDMPVQITNWGQGWVEFTVSQKWKDGGLSWFATEYQKEEDGNWTCPKLESDLTWATTAGPYRAKCDENGIARVTTIAHDGSFQHAENIDIPETCQQVASSDTGKKTMHVFNVPCDCAAAAALAAESTTTDSLAYDCSVPVECTQELLETFKSGEAACWTNGLESVDGDSNQFLGRLGYNNDEVFRTFQVPQEATNVILEFDFYDIGERMPKDTFILQIEQSALGLQLDTTSNGVIENFPYEIVKSGSTSHVKMIIPRGLYQGDGQLFISFKVETTESIDDDSYGVDNFKLVAECPGRELDQEQYGWKRPVQEPSFYVDEDEGYYCSAEDFPCEDEEGPGKVHVCHYSTRKGYQTFCVPEEDSEILRFYKNDYCGPCVGGYGGVNLQ